MPNLLQQLNADHPTVERLFTEFESTRDRSTALNLCDVLTRDAPAGTAMPVLAQIDRIRSMPPDDPSFVTTVRDLRRVLQEDDTPAWSSPTPTPTPTPTPSWSTPPTEVRGTASTADVSSMKKDELYELAKQRKLKGRSNMTKDELIQALSS